MKDPKDAELVPNTRLKQQRELRNWTQGRLAVEIGTTSINVSRWERGLTMPSPHFRRKLCELFKQTPEELGLVREAKGEPAHRRPEQAAPTGEIAQVHDSSIPSQSPATHGLVGRDELLHHLRLRLCVHSGAVALTGLPGIGKTALALELAYDRHIQDHFREGLLWAGLGNRPNVVGLLAHWGALLGIPPAEVMKLTGVDAWARAIHDAIGVRRLLLVIDDAWRIEDALLFKVGGPHCTYLLTTRFPELAYHFARDNVVTVHELSEEDSIGFLKQLVPELSTNEPADVRELVQSVGGLPLALTLIGRHLQLQVHSGQPRRLRSALERLRRADERLKLEEPQAPAELPPSLPPGSAVSLQAIIQVSDRQLSAEAREVLRALSVFPAKPNSFSEEAALAVSASPVEKLDELLDAGLLESSGPGHYMLHQTIADYAMLHRSGANIEERMVVFFVSYVQQHSADYETLSLASHNILTAFQIAAGRGMFAALVQGVNAFAPFLETAGLYSAAETLLKRARQAALDTGDTHGLAEIWFHEGRIAELRGERALAEQAYQEGLTVARKIGRRELMSAILAHWGELIVNSGDYARAEHSLLEGLDLAREFNDRHRMSILLKNLGEVADCRGDYEQGNEFYQQGLDLAREVGDREIMSAILQNLGVKAERRGEYALADSLYEEGIKWAREIGHRQRMSALFMNMGMLAYKQQQFKEAESLYLESLDLARKIGHPLRTSSVLQNLGALAGVRENYKQAEVYLQESLELAYKIENLWLISETQYEWGQLYLKQQRLDEAQEAFEKALAIARDIKAMELICFTLYGLARIAAARGLYSDARRYGKESQAPFAAMGHEMAGEIARWLDSLPG